MLQNSHEQDILASVQFQLQFLMSNPQHPFRIVLPMHPEIINLFCNFDNHMEYFLAEAQAQLKLLLSDEGQGRDSQLVVLHFAQEVLS